MKKLVSLLLAVMMVVSIFAIVPLSVDAASTNFSLALNKKYSGTLETTSLYGVVMSRDYHYYNFTMSKSCNVKVSFSTKADVSWSLRSSDYSDNTGTQTKSKLVYLTKGKSYTITVSGSGKYAIKVTKAAANKLKLKNKSGKLGTSNKTVKFSFSGTGDYAIDNLKVTSGNKKIATVTHRITSSKSGTFTITPKKMGKVVITLKMKGGNKLKYTAYVTKTYWFVAKGCKSKAPAPAGVKKPTWKSANKKVATINKKTGKINAKKGGRVNFTAKKGKISYKVITVVTDYKVLGKKTYKKIKSVVNNPEKLKIYNVYRGYSKLVYTGKKVPIIMVDYGSTNDYGAMTRKKMVAWYDDVHEIKYATSWDEDNIIGKKSMSPSSIK